YGGNGPMHAAVYGAELGVKEIIIPAVASTFSALGLATSDILHSYRLFQYNPMPMEAEKLNNIFATLEKQADDELARDGINELDRSFKYAMDMRWGSQYYTLRMQVERKQYDKESVEALCSQFDKLYESLYGKGSAYTPSGRFVTTFMVDGIGKIRTPALTKSSYKGSDASEAIKGKRRVFFQAFGEYHPTDIYDFALLGAGNDVSGPAILEAVQTTIVIPPGQKATIDDYLNVIIE
ncbi:hydantoinase/oxoprolinase family protein, partial [Chloroflexota bacterium]